jgi:hypothetical protein
MRSQPDDDIPGSPWWRAVSKDLLRWAVTVLRRRAVRAACPTPTCCTAGPIGIGLTGGPSSRSCVGNRQGVSSTQALRRPLSGPVAAGTPQSRSAKTRPVEPVSARSRRRWANQPAVCAAGRNHRPQPTHRAGYVELRGARHGQHRIVGRLRQPRTARALAASLLDGEIRSAFAMTEPAVASSDARNVATSIVRDGDSYVISGRKWFTSGALSPPLRRQAWPRSGGCAPPGLPSARARRC